MYSQKKHSVLDYLVKSGYYALVVGVAAGILFCIKLLFVPLLASVLLAFVLDPVVNMLEMRGLKRFTAIIVLYLAFIVAAGGGVVLAGPRVVSEGENLAANLPQYKAMARDMVVKGQELLLERFPQLQIPDLFALARERLGGRGPDVDALIAGLSNFFSLLSVAVIVPIVTFFVLADGHLIQKTLLAMVPNRYFEMCILLFHKIVTALKLFVRGQMIDAAAVGILTTIGMLCIGMPYAFVIGIVAGLGNLIPYLGPIIGFMPALFVLLVTPGMLSGFMVVLVIVVFVVVQFVEGTFVYPIAVGQSSNLHPLVVIIGITVGGQVAGILGMLVAIPLISIARVSLEVLYSNLKSYSII